VSVHRGTFQVIFSQRCSRHEWMAFVWFQFWNHSFKLPGMKPIRYLLPIIFLLSAATAVFAQVVGSFPPPDTILVDAKHKESKSGVQFGPGNTLIIQDGVGTPTSINVLSFSKDGKLLAAGKDFGRVVVWDVPSHRFVCAVDRHQRIVNALAISPDDHLLVTAGEGDHRNVELWRLPEGKHIKTYKGFDTFVSSLAFGPGGKWLLVSSNSGFFALDVSTGKHLLDLPDVTTAVLSEDGQTMLVPGRWRLQLLNTSDWTKVHEYALPVKYPYVLDMNLQRDELLAASTRGFRLLHLSTGKPFLNSPMPRLPKLNLSAGGIASFDAGTPLVLGHSDWPSLALENAQQPGLRLTGHVQRERCSQP